MLVWSMAGNECRLCSAKPLRNSKSQIPNPKEFSSFNIPIMHSEAPGTDQPKPFDLEERAALFGEQVLRFLRRVPRHPANDRLVGQLAGAATSVGANFCEASESVSPKDFRNIIGRCRKEAKESRFFLRMLAAALPEMADEARVLYREARELHLILAAMGRNSETNSKSSPPARSSR